MLQSRGKTICYHILINMQNCVCYTAVIYDDLLLSLLLLLLLLLLLTEK